MNHKKDPTVFIIDDDPEMLNSLRWLMGSVQINTEIFSNASLFLEKYDVHRKGCILLDIRMPGMSGLELLDTLGTLKNCLPVIIITGHGDISMAIRAMKSGAMDFILKPFSDQYLIDQIQKAIKQISTISPVLEDSNIVSRFSTLTAREQEIMFLIITGKLNKQIANDLHIAISTVEYHRARLMKKMQAKNIVELVKMGGALLATST